MPEPVSVQSRMTLFLGESFSSDVEGLTIGFHLAIALAIRHPEWVMAYWDSWKLERPSDQVLKRVIDGFSIKQE